jgi:thiamine biosynthesis lipoprotein
MLGMVTEMLGSVNVKKYTLPVLLFLSMLGLGQQKEYVTVKKALTLMGSRFEITVVSTNEELGHINIQEAAGEIERIEHLISSWDPNSETSEINRNAGVRPVVVSSELFKLIERCKQISEITYGAFDISYAGMDSLWQFKGSMTQLPTKNQVQQALKNVGYQKIILNTTDRSVFLREKGMKLSFAGIGKGYAVDKAKELLVSKQVVAGVINAGGDITTWGTKASGEKWLIGVTNPKSKGKVYSWLPLLESSVATAEYSDKYFDINGKRYAHIIDPRTGYPAVGINSVSVFSKTAELSDALATALVVMGRDAGLALVNQLGGTEVIMVDDQDNMYKSSGIIFNQNP